MTRCPLPELVLPLSVVELSAVRLVQTVVAGGPD